jgi:hypothetical protein
MVSSDEQRGIICGLRIRGRHTEEP